MTPPEGDVPWAPLFPPERRHFIAALRYRPRKVTRVNTVFEPWVDVQADVDAINSGLAEFDGQTYTCNGRSYRFHDDRLYPVSGPGLIQLSATAYRMLGIYNAFGDSEEAFRAWELGGRRP